MNTTARDLFPDIYIHGTGIYKRYTVIRRDAREVYKPLACTFHVTRYTDLYNSGIYKLSKVVAKFCFIYGVNLDDSFFALKQQVRAMFQATCIVSLVNFLCNLFMYTSVYVVLSISFSLARARARARVCVVSVIYFDE